MTPLTPSLLARLENAVRSETRGELEAALERYRSVLDHDMDNFEALSLLGKLECRLGDHGAAVFHLQRAARLAPERADVHLGLGYALANAGEQRRAVRAFLDALEADPTYAPAYVSLGCVFAQHEQHDLAQRAFSFARQAGSEYPEVHYQLGKYYVGIGRTEPALAALLNAERLGGRFDDMHFLLARLYLNQGNYEKSLQHLEFYADVAPRSTEACVLKATALIELGEYDDALKASQLALQFEPRNVDALILIGRVHFLRDDLKGARRSFQAAINMDQRASAAHAGLSEVCAQEGQVNKALHHIKRAGDPKKYDVETAILCARLLHVQNQDDEAIRLLNYRLNSRLDSAAGRRKCHFQLAQLYESQNDCSRAYQHYTRANDLRRQLSKESGNSDARLIRFFDRNCMARLRRVEAQSPLPVFITGMPGFAVRLVRLLIECHPDVTASTHRLPLKTLANSVPSVLATPTPFPDALQEARKAELKVLATQYRASNFFGVAQVAVDTHHENSPYLGFASQLFPNMRVIQVVQKPADLALDLFTQETPTSHAELPASMQAIKSRIEELDEVMAHWAALKEFPLLTVNYEQLVSQPRAALERIMGFIGIESHPALYERLRKPGPNGDLLSQARGKVNRSERFKAHMSEFFEAAPEV